MPNTEQGVALQSDELKTVSGGPIRTCIVTAIINGVPTQVQMQVISIADAHGNILETPYDPRQTLLDICNVLKDIRAAACKLADLPVADNIETRADNPGVSS